MVERDGWVSLLSADLERPVSLWLSDDERHLFALDGVTGRLWRYHLDVMWPGELVGTIRPTTARRRLSVLRV